MATTIQVGTAAMGGYAAPAHISNLLLMENSGKHVFRKFAKPPPTDAIRSGTAVTFNIWSDAAAVGSAVAETATIPQGTTTARQVSLTIEERGQYFSHSEISKVCMASDPEQIVKKVLARDNLNSLETAAEAAMAACYYRYVGTATNGGDWSTDGTTTGTGAGPLNKYHLSEIVDYMRWTMKAPAFDNREKYAGIASGKAARNLKNDSSFESYRLYSDANGLLEGEIGMLEGVRWFEGGVQASGFDNSIGASSESGEAYIFGDDALFEMLVIADNVRYQEEDFGRDKRWAWHVLTGFGAMLYNIVKWDSE